MESAAPPAHRKKSAAATRKFRLAQRLAAFFPAAAAARLSFRLARRRNSAADRSRLIDYVLRHVNLLVLLVTLFV